MEVFHHLLSSCRRCLNLFGLISELTLECLYFVCLFISRCAEFGDSVIDITCKTMSFRVTE